MFFFLTIFVQNVWGYSPLKTGIAFLPITAMIILASGIASQAVPCIGARPLMIAGSAIMAGGMFWLSRITEHSSYTGGLLGPMLITALGLGLLFVPMALVSLTKVRNADTGVASSLVNVGQQVGGSIGLALLGTIAWSAVATSLQSQTAAAAAKAVLDRIRRDVGSGLASGQVLGTPTLFIDGVVHRGGYDPPALLAALAP